MSRRYATMALALALVACGEETTTTAAPSTEAPTGAPSEPPTGAPSGPPEQAPPDEAEPPDEEARAEGDEAPAPDTPPVNLLTVAPTSVAVSSVYEGRFSQVERLVDGNPETAWNSRTGDLEGAWIAFRLPPGARLSAIELTVGFTHRTARADLFTGNHRIRRVRVTRDGEPLGEHTLDPSSQEMQTIPVSGPRGDYRVEILDLEPGTRDDWREVCVSELRVMGHLGPGEAPGRYTPALGVEGLPALPMAEVDSDEAVEDLEIEIESFTVLWEAYEAEQIHAEFQTGEPGVSGEEAQSFRQERRESLGSLASVVAPASTEHERRLRELAAQPVGIWRWRERRADLDTPMAALAVATQNDPALRCRVARSHVQLLLGRLVELAEWERESTEWSEMEISSGSAYEDADADPEVVAAQRDADRAQRELTQIHDLQDTWASDPAGTGRRIQAAPRPSSPLLRPEWDALNAPLRDAAQHCRQ